MVRQRPQSLTLEVATSPIKVKDSIPRLLRVEIDEDSSDRLLNCSWQWGEKTYRRDGFSIGRDYLRLEGRTVMRGSLKPEHLSPLDQVLGKGAFSTVQLALWKTDSNDSDRQRQYSASQDGKVNMKKVAIKRCCLMENSKERRDMLLQELKTLCLVDCPALVKLHGAFLEMDTVTTVLEYMDFGSLDDLFSNVRSKQTLDSDEAGLPEIAAAAISFQALSGLSYLHNDRILHRDLKPSNILLSSSGTVKLCDFGMAVLDDATLHKTAVGTTVYMAPERLRAKAYGRSSDIWSFGLVLLQCMSGSPPPWARLQSIVDLLVTVEDTDLEHGCIPQACKGRSGQVIEVLTACLQHDPTRRIPAALLRCSPWFEVFDIRNDIHASKILRAFQHHLSKH